MPKRTNIALITDASSAQPIKNLYRPLENDDVDDSEDDDVMERSLQADQQEIADFTGNH